MNVALISVVGQGGNMDTLSAMKRQVKQFQNQIVSVANAADREVLLSVKQAVDEELCTFLLFGQETKIRTIADEINLDIFLPNIIVQDSANCAIDAVQAIHKKQAQLLMKGNIATKELLTAVLHKEYGLRTGKILSHVSLFEIPSQNKLLILTDAAMNINPNLKEKAEIIRNAVIVARGIGMELPKVAVLAPVEVVNEAMPSTVDAAILTQMQKRGQIKNCLVDGPLAFDIAVSPSAKEQKGIDSPVAGRADILIVPSIEVGNALYKSFIHFSGAKVAGIICGASVPIILTSRADSAESKLYSLLLALLTSTKV